MLLNVLKNLRPFINELKQLIIRTDHISRPILITRLAWVKERVKKKLALADIDMLLVKAESNTSNHLHMMNVLSEVTIQELSDETQLFQNSWSPLQSN